MSVVSTIVPLEGDTPVDLAASAALNDIIDEIKKLQNFNKQGFSCEDQGFSSEDQGFSSEDQGLVGEAFGILSADFELNEITCSLGSYMAEYQEALQSLLVKSNMVPGVAEVRIAALQLLQELEAERATSAKLQEDLDAEHEESARFKQESLQLKDDNALVRAHLESFELKYRTLETAAEEAKQQSTVQVQHLRQQVTRLESQGWTDTHAATSCRAGEQKALMEVEKLKGQLAIAENYFNTLASQLGGWSNTRR